MRASAVVMMTIVFASFLPFDDVGQQVAARDMRDVHVEQDQKGRFTVLQPFLRRPAIDHVLHSKANTRATPLQKCLQDLRRLR
jgi:hypothetical protein